jgi:hypothetical protein
MWAGPVAIILFLVGYLFVAGLVPPPSPDRSATQIANFYAYRQTRLLSGCVVVFFTGPLLYAWAAGLSSQLRQMQPPESPLPNLQLVAGATLTLFLFLPIGILAVAAYRADTRPPDITLALSDLAWLLFIGPAGPAVMQCLAIGLATLTDDDERPVFPRWVGYFNIWAGIVYTGAALVFLFKSGPFAWNGIFPFWLPLVVFTLWVGVNTWASLASIARSQHAEDGQQLQWA